MRTSIISQSIGHPPTIDHCLALVAATDAIQAMIRVLKVEDADADMKLRSADAALKEARRWPLPG